MASACFHSIQDCQSNRPLVVVFFGHVAGFLHFQLAHFAVEVGAVQAEAFGGFAHVAAHAFDGAADVFLLEEAGRFFEAQVG